MSMPATCLISSLVRWAAAPTPDDPFTLNKVFSMYFVTESGKRAGLRLIDLYLERGEFSAAAWVADRMIDWHPDLTVDRVFLVAPWLNVQREEDTDFFEFEIDPGIVERTNGFAVFASDNDRQEALNTVEHLREKLPTSTAQSSMPARSSSTSRVCG